jgi:hypothetical protein
MKNKRKSRKKKKRIPFWAWPSARAFVFYIALHLCARVRIWRGGSLKLENKQEKDNSIAAEVAYCRVSEPRLIRVAGYEWFTPRGLDNTQKAIASEC